MPGLPTRIIAQLLPCLDKPQTIYVPDVTPEMIATLQREQAGLSEHRMPGLCLAAMTLRPSMQFALFAE